MATIERPTIGSHRRLELEVEDVRREYAALLEAVVELRQKLRLRLTPEQARDMLDENHELRCLNEILIQRNTILARDARKA